MRTTIRSEAVKKPDDATIGAPASEAARAAANGVLDAGAADRDSTRRCTQYGEGWLKMIDRLTIFPSRTLK
jgi:hypothetical protein